MKNTALATLLLLATSANAQTVTSVRERCIQNEATLVMLYAGLDAASKQWKPEMPETHPTSRQAKALQDSVKSVEESWQRLGCASILYAKQ